MNRRTGVAQQHLWPVVDAMMQEGKSAKDIAQALGLPDAKAVENLAYRERRRGKEEKKTLQKKTPKKLPQKPAGDKMVEKLRKENEQLRMEVDLLRAFHREVGRR